MSDSEYEYDEIDPGDYTVLLEVQVGGGDIDFDKLKWGSFTRQLRDYNKTNDTDLDLREFAELVLQPDSRFHAITRRRAQFYLNVLSSGGDFRTFLDKLGRKALDVKQRINLARGGPRGWPPQSRDLLKKYGNKKIDKDSLYVCRAPISVNTFVKNLHRLLKGDNPPFDSLYHLRLVFKVEGGPALSFDKTEVLRLRLLSDIPEDQKQDCMKVDWGNTPEKTLEQFLNASRRKEGNLRFFGYDSITNNCQQAIMSVLEANGITPPTEFILQDVSNLFPDTVKQLARASTELARIINILSEGAGHSYDISQKINGSIS